MAGHSKWANIQHRKNRQDAKRAKVFTKIVREITVAARLGGADPEANPRLRAAVSAARAASMPAENVQRAIDKGTGTAGGDAIEEVVYEGYGPGGVAVLVEGMTDNRNRTAAEIRHLFSKSGGSLAESGAVAWQFERQSLVLIPKEGIDEERITELVIESGGDDYDDAGDAWAITAPGTDLHAVTQALADQEVEITLSDWIMVPSNEVDLESSVAGKIVAMIDHLDDHDDVQRVWTNANPDTLALDE